MIALLAGLAGGLIGGTVTAWVVLTVVRREAERHWRREVDDLEQRAERQIEALGHEVEERVKRGVVEGVAALPSAETLRSTRSAAVRAAGEIVGEGLSGLLRGPGNKRKR